MTSVDIENVEKIVEESTPAITTNSDLNYGLKETLRAMRFELSAIRAEVKFGLRKGFRELKFLLRLFDLMIIFLLIGIGIIMLFVFTVVIIPLLLSILPESIVGNVNDTIFGSKVCFDGDTYSSANCEKLVNKEMGGWPFTSGYDPNNPEQPMFSGFINSILGLWLNDTTLRVLVGGAGALGIVIRLLFKSDIDKFKDKVNARDEVTYVFGSTIYAEKFLQKLVFTYAYEDHAALITDKKFLWVQKIGGLLDSYVVEDPIEFEKRNLYDIVGFKNAKRVYILTDNVEYNQNILTNMRAVRPDVPIYILSQYTPQYLISGQLVKDEYLHIIDDVKNTREALVKSLSLNINFPDCTEVNVVGNYVGLPAIRVTKDVIGVEVLAVRRPNIDDKEWTLLPPETILQRTDRMILHVTWDFANKRINRIVSELPVRHLVDLGQLKVRNENGKFISSKITDAPNRILYVEPNGTGKSWVRRVLFLLSIIFLSIGLIIGRDPDLNPFTGIPLDFFGFFSGIIGLIIFRWMYPVTQKGIMTWSKHEKLFHKRTKSFSKFGKDLYISFDKATKIRVIIHEISKKRLSFRRSEKSIRDYYFQEQDEKLTACITLIVTKDEKTQLVLERFENRLKVYTNLEISEIYEELTEVSVLNQELINSENFEETPISANISDNKTIDTDVIDKSTEINNTEGDDFV